MSERVIVEQNFIDDVVVPETPIALGNQQIFVLCSLPTITIGVTFAIDGNGHLIATYSNGDVIDIGKVVGQDGNIVKKQTYSVSPATDPWQVTLESNKLFINNQTPAHEGTVQITVPSQYISGSFSEVSFVSNDYIEANGITITNNRESTEPLKLVQYGMVITTSQFRPKSGSHVSLLFCNNGLNIICGIAEV